MAAACSQDASAVWVGMAPNMAKEEVAGNRSARPMSLDKQSTGICSLFCAPKLSKKTASGKALTKKGGLNAVKKLGLLRKATAKKGLELEAQEVKVDLDSPKADTGGRGSVTAAVPAIGVFAGKDYNPDKVNVSTAPFEPALPSVLTIRTSNGGMRVGSISGTNIPEIMRGLDSAFQSSQAIADAVGLGFTLDTTTTDPSGPMEMIFMLTRQGASGAKPAATQPVATLPTTNGAQRSTSATTDTSEPDVAKAVRRRVKKVPKYEDERAGAPRPGPGWHPDA